MTGPKWDVDAQPCPVCGKKKLVYDGSVKWRSGTRPPRSLAKKGSLGSSPRADFEIAHYLHCAKCGTTFYDPVDGHKPSLHIEQAPGAGERPEEVSETAVDADQLAAKPGEPAVDSSQPAAARDQQPPRDRWPRSETGFPPGSIGDISARIGYDVRDLKMAGYSDAEIDDVLYGRRTLEDLLQSKPGKKSK